MVTPTLWRYEIYIVQRQVARADECLIDQIQLSIFPSFGSITPIRRRFMKTSSFLGRLAFLINSSIIRSTARDWPQRRSLGVTPCSHCMKPFPSSSIAIVRYFLASYDKSQGVTYTRFTLTLTKCGAG